MKYIVSFQKITDYLKSISIETKYFEDDTDVKIEFMGKMGDFIELGHNEWIKTDIGSRKYSIIVKYEEHYITFSNLTKKTFYNEREVHLSLQFNKTDNLYQENLSVLVYFNLDTFLNKLKNKHLSFFLDVIEQKYIFIPITESYSNGFINLLPLEKFEENNKYNANIENPQSTKLIDIKDIYLNFNSGYNLPAPIIFRINNIKNKKLQRTLNYCQVFLVTTFLANRRLDDNNLIFKGYQTLDLKISDFFIPKHTDDFNHLFDFVFDKDKFIDKIEITRNIFSLYLSEHATIESLDSSITKIRGSITDHFTAYIQKQIKDFFDQRKDVVKEAYSAALEAKEIADKIVTNINLILLGLVTASLIGVFSYSKGDKKLFVLALILHTIYFFINFIVNILNHKDKKKDVEKSFDNYVDQFSILNENEITKIKTSYLFPALNRLKIALKCYTIISIILIFLMATISILGFQIEFPNEPDNKSIKYFAKD